MKPEECKWYKPTEHMSSLFRKDQEVLNKYILKAIEVYYYDEAWEKFRPIARSRCGVTRGRYYNFYEAMVEYAEEKSCHVETAWSGNIYLIIPDEEQERLF